MVSPCPHESVVMPLTGILNPVTCMTIFMTVEVSEIPCSLNILGGPTMHPGIDLWNPLSITNPFNNITNLEKPPRLGMPNLSIVRETIQTTLDSRPSLQNSLAHRKVLDWYLRAILTVSWFMISVMYLMPMQMLIEPHLLRLTYVRMLVTYELFPRTMDTAMVILHHRQQDCHRENLSRDHCSMGHDFMRLRLIHALTTTMSRGNATWELVRSLCNICLKNLEFDIRIRLHQSCVSLWNRYHASKGWTTGMPLEQLAPMLCRATSDGEFI